MNGATMRRSQAAVWSFETVVVAGLAALALMVAWWAPVLGQEAAGVSYEGTQEAGGPVRLTVSADGARIVLFEVEGVAGGGCSWDTIPLANWGDEIVLTEGRFEATNADGDVLTGGWVENGSPERRLEGTIQVNDPTKGCQTPPLRWVAAPTP